MLKEILNIIIWCTLGTSCLVLLIAAMKKKDEKLCTNINVQIKEVNNLAFISKQDISNTLQQNGITKSKLLQQINLRKVEEILEKNPWIKNAELFFDNNQVFYAIITEREPIARVFTLAGNSFYIDKNALRLPVSEAQAARLPVFTSYPSDKNILSHKDSLVLNDITTIAKYINNDSFWLAQTAQINISSQRTYELIPVLGNQVIELGDANDLKVKFQKLFAFYQQVWAKAGFEKYEKINVQFKNQIVAERRGMAKPHPDTLKAIKKLRSVETVMNEIIKDTAFASDIEKLNSADSITVVKKTISKMNKRAVKETTLPVKKNTAITEENKKQVPKAVMKKPD